MKGSLKLAARNMVYCSCFSKVVLHRMRNSSRKLDNVMQIVVKEEIQHQPVLCELDSQSEKSVNMLEFQQDGR